MIDTCASEFKSYVPYFYSTYEEENESVVSDRKKIVVLGSGPIRIGQGVEFDYSTVHAIKTIRENGFEAIIINNNPETVSTDYTTSDKLYFEPLYAGRRHEYPAFGTAGGRHRLSRRADRHQSGGGAAQPGRDGSSARTATPSSAPRTGTRLKRLMEELKIPQPRGEAVTNIEDGVRVSRGDRLSRSGPPQLCSGRPRDADRRQREGAPHLPGDCGQNRRKTARARR